MSDWVALADDRPSFDAISPTSRADSRVKVHLSNLLWLTVWLAILGSSLYWRAQHLDAFGLSNDEGAHVMWAKLAAQGHPLYEETRAVQSPLFLETIALAFRVGGISLTVGRSVMLTTYFLLALAISALAHRYGGTIAALAALFLLAVSPLVFTFSRLVMAEIPATALAVTALALALHYIDSQKRPWLIASALCLGLSFITKALHPFIIVPIGLLFLRQPKPLAQILRHDLLWWSITITLPVVTLLFIYPPAALYEQLVQFRGQLRAAVPGSWAETSAQFMLFAPTHWGLWLLAAFAVLYEGYPHPHPLSQRERGDKSDTLSKLEGVGVMFSNSLALWERVGVRAFPLTLIWLIWLITGAAMLLWHTPLFPHHFIILLPPLILLSTRPFTQAYHLMKQRQFPALQLGVILLAALNLPAMVKANQATAAIVTGGRETDALTLLQAVSLPQNYLMGDSQLLIFMAARQTPPPMGDVALVAIKAGLQDSRRMQELTEDYHAPAVVQWSLRLPWLPDYLTWVEANYLAKRVWDNDHIIYFAPRLALETPLPHAQITPLGDSLTLRGYDITQRDAAHLWLKVYWQTAQPLTENYTIFTQLLNSHGQLVASWDSQPLGGNFPTSAWPAHETITDLIQLPLPADLPAGDYTLITGMYRLETLTRLTTKNGQDYIQLGIMN